MEESNPEDKRISKLVDKKPAKEYMLDSITTVLRRLAKKPLQVIRNSSERVILIPEFARGGNWLYEWCAAYQYSQNQVKTSISYLPGMAPWLEEFPALQRYTLSTSKIPFKFQRMVGHHQNMGEHFNNTDLKSFIDNCLISSESFQQRRLSNRYIDHETLVINVRRGDYFSNSKIREQFGIRTAEYINCAIQEMKNRKEFKKIVITSDDLLWCAANLQFLKNYAPTHFSKIGEGMFDDLATISLAPLLILTNTTFGYWGGYIASSLHDATVIVPDVHERALIPKGVPHHHLDSWISVSSPTGTWLDNSQ